MAIGQKDKPSHTDWKEGGSKKRAIGKAYGGGGGPEYIYTHIGNRVPVVVVQQFHPQHQQHGQVESLVPTPGTRLIALFVAMEIANTHTHIRAHGEGN